MGSSRSHAVDDEKCALARSFAVSAAESSESEATTEIPGRGD
jgi:hypothetical protein